MIGHAAGIRRLDGIIWAIIVALAVTILMAPLASNFQLMGRSFLMAGGATVLSFAGYWLYQTHRPDARLASALGGTAQIVAFAAVGAPFSYIAASFDLPLRDAWFDAADRALGLDWSALLNWMDAHANLHPLFRLIYLSLLPQTVIVVLALAQLMGMGRKASLPSPACTLRLPSSLRWACGRSRYFAGSQRRSIR
ncbi:MAG: phosphatase PAP2 family protein [Sphingobacteriales bacterium]|jgi:hypothetical protein